LAWTCLGLTGCASQYADRPAPTRFAREEQGELLKLQAVRHWQLIADHFAGQLADNLNGRLNGRALYVPRPEGEQAFVGGFRKLLTASLVNKGVPVAASESGALVADLSYDIYRFNRESLADTYYRGEATMLAAGLWAFGGAMRGITHANPAPGVAAGAALVTAAAGLEGFGWLVDEGLGKGRYASGPEPKSEILLIVSVADGNRIVSVQSNIYYATDEDPGLYWRRSGSGRTLRVLDDCGIGRASCAR
jgi:hypothetical protein